MLQSISPLSPISFMESIPLVKSLGSDSTGEAEEKSEKDELREKIEELEKKVERKPDRIGGSSPKPNFGNRNSSPLNDKENPFEDYGPTPWKTGDPQEIKPWCDNVWRTTSGSQTHRAEWTSRA